MDTSNPIDITFDFRSDTPPGKDPDTFSPTLRRYHKLVWSRPLPCGRVFELDDTKPGVYLHHQSEVDEYFLASDAVVPTFLREPRTAHYINQIAIEEREDFLRIGYTIGGMMLFPGNKIDNKMAINSARGFHPRIKDRFDLTVECIRRHYRNEDSPLCAVLARYKEFFQLFNNFRGYVDFFLLQDLVTEDYSKVRFFAPLEFDSSKRFKSWPIPASVVAYQSYRERAVAFLEARNRRIHAELSHA